MITPPPREIPKTQILSFDPDVLQATLNYVDPDHVGHIVQDLCELESTNIFNSDEEVNTSIANDRTRTKGTCGDNYLVGGRYEIFPNQTIQSTFSLIQKAYDHIAKRRAVLKYIPSLDKNPVPSVFAPSWKSDLIRWEHKMLIQFSDTGIVKPVEKPFEHFGSLYLPLEHLSVDYGGFLKEGFLLEKYGAKKDFVFGVAEDVLLFDLLDNLCLLEDKNIIHGDINQRNVLFKKSAEVSNGSLPVQKSLLNLKSVLIDFAFAQQDGAHCYDWGSKFMGSDFYIAPEVYKVNSVLLDSKIDTYSFGKLLLLSLLQKDSYYGGGGLNPFPAKNISVAAKGIAKNVVDYNSILDGFLVEHIKTINLARKENFGSNLFHPSLENLISICLNVPEDRPTPIELRKKIRKLI